MMYHSIPTTHLPLIERLTDLFSVLPQVESIALGGSLASGAGDATSDIDLYVFTRAEIPLVTRQAIVEQSGGASQSNIGLTYWGPGDEWYNTPTGIEVDIIYFDTAWMEEQIRQVVQTHQAHQGYTTCLWYTVRQAQPFYDAHGWLANLQQLCQQAYPEPLRQNIIQLNHPLLREIIPAYAHQMEKALQRRDLVSLNHRLAALLASYFDILFAFNRELHPGEKRLVALAQARCVHLPVQMAEDVAQVLIAAATADPSLLSHLTRLLDRLDDLLAGLVNG